MTTVVIVEPKPLIRLGIEHYLNRVFPEIKIRSCDEVIEEDNFLLPYHCDLLLLSVKANACVQSAISSAQQQYACSKLLLLSDAVQMPATWEDLPATVVGYMGYGSPLQSLTRTIRNALQLDYQPSKKTSNGSPLVEDHRTSNHAQLTELGSTALDTFLLQQASAITHEKISVSSKLAKREIRHLGLTPRQYQVLVYLAHGQTNEEIRRHLAISLSTVRKHTQGIYTRLDVNNRNEAVYKALKLGASLGLRLSSLRAP